MNLHLDRVSFLNLMSEISNRTGQRLDVLEKDYYVVLLLKDLAEKQKNGLKAYFKGGTALYKALKVIGRFSEDIDLSVDTRDCTRTQSDKRLEQATKKYSFVERIASEGKTNRSEVVAVYKYVPVDKFDFDDSLERFGKLKVEATSFTISEPVADLEISSLIYDLATDEQKKILQEEYDMSPFKVKTITLERIFIDKLFAAEAYFRKAYDPHKAADAAKHIYDLAVMSKLPQMLSLYENDELLERLLNIRLEEELSRLDGIPNVLPKDFTFFAEIAKNENMEEAYLQMIRRYTLLSSAIIPYEEAVDNINFIYNNLSQSEAWNYAPIYEEIIIDCFNDETFDITHQ